MTYNAVVTLANGTQKPIEVDVTVGQVRKYRDDPNPCQCADCQRTFIPAVRVLGLQEDFLARKITAKQLKRGLKQLGYVRGEKIQYN
jgi:hypothetical protein